MWPCRMAWLLQIAEDVLQEHDIEKKTCFNFKKSGINLKQAVIKTCAGKTKEALDFPTLLYRLPLVEVYHKIVKSLIHAMPQDDSASFLHRDDDPQMFELLLQESDEDLEDVLTMADLHPLDNASHFEDLSVHSLRPYIFNLPDHMLQEVTKTLSSILLFLKEATTTTENEIYLAYKKCSKFYDLGELDLSRLQNKMIYNNESLCVADANNDEEKKKQTGEKGEISM